MPPLVMRRCRSWMVLPAITKSVPKDEELTTFHTPKGIYCYKVMPFGLMNADTTYQRAMQNIFDDLLHKNVECSDDDLVVNSRQSSDHWKY